MTDPQVSIILPVHGNTSFLRDALNSIRTQSAPERIKECIVVFDRVEQEVKSQFQKEFSNNFWRFLDSPEPGIVSALNFGIAQSRTEFIARMDSDDLMLPTRISDQLLRFQEEPSLVLLGTQIVEIDVNGSYLRERIYPTKNHSLQKRLKIGNVFAHPSVLFKKEIFLKVGGYREFYEYAEDYDLWLRMSEFGSIGNLDKSLLNYRIHLGQISAKKKRKQLIAENAARSANRNRSRSKVDPSLNFKSIDEWWKFQTKGLGGMGRKFELNLKLKFYGSKSRFIRLACIFPLFFLNPSLVLKASLHKIRTLIS